ARRGEADRLLAEARAQSRAAGDAEAQAYAAFDGQDWPGGEKRWAEALKLAKAADQTYARASGAIEAALALAPQRKSLRAQFAGVTLERIRLAERDHRRAQRDELATRLPPYDDDGSYQRRLDAPARLSVDSDPKGARASLARYVDHDGHWQ